MAGMDVAEHLAIRPRKWIAGSETHSAFTENPSFLKSGQIIGIRVPTNQRKLRISTACTTFGLRWSEKARWTVLTIGAVGQAPTRASSTVTCRLITAAGYSATSS